MPRMRRRYNEEELASQRSARRLHGELGINAAGIEVILRMRKQLLVLQANMAEMEAQLNRYAQRRSARLASWRAAELDALWEELMDL
jgi:hypothetical protein